jgi:PIN domain nuclease of toxin-antitoxin system
MYCGFVEPDMRAVAKSFGFGPASLLAPLRHEIVLIAQQLPLPHCDPADRFLAATAQLMDLTVVTADDDLLRLGTIRTMKN